MSYLYAMPLGFCLISVFIFLSHFIIADSFIKYRYESTLRMSWDVIINIYLHNINRALLSQSFTANILHENKTFVASSFVFVTRWIILFLFIEFFVKFSHQHNQNIFWLLLVALFSSHRYCDFVLFILFVEAHWLVPKNRHDIGQKRLWPYFSRQRNYQKKTRNWRHLLFAKEMHRLLWNGIKTISKRVNFGLFSEENDKKNSSKNFLWPAVARNITSAYESSSVKNTHQKYHIQFVRIKTWLWISM